MRSTLARIAGSMCSASQSACRRSHKPGPLPSTLPSNAATSGVTRASAGARALAPSCASVIILQINVDGILAFPAECQSPVAGDRQRPPPRLAAQGMKPVAGQVHLFGSRRLVERQQHKPHPIGILDAQSLWVAGLPVTPRPVAD